MGIARDGYQVYYLTDPTNSKTRYVGVTTYSLNKRLRDHCHPTHLKQRTHKNNWIRSLAEKGLNPVINALSCYSSENEMLKAEIYWIKLFKELGHELTNSNDGGSGSLNPTKQTLIKRSLALTGKKRTLETRRKMSEASKNRPPLSLESRARMSASRKGKKLTDEHKEKVRLAGIGRKHSDQTKLKMSLVQKGHIGSTKAIVNQFGSVYASIKDAAEKLNMSRGTLSSYIKSKRYYRGHLFSFVKNGD